MYVLNYPQSTELHNLLALLLALDTLNPDERSMLENTLLATEQVKQFNGMLNLSLTSRRFQWIRDIAKRNGERPPFIQILQAERDVKDLKQLVESAIHALESATRAHSAV